MASAHFLLCRHDMSAALTVIASIDWSCEIARPVRKLPLYDFIPGVRCVRCVRYSTAQNGPYGKFSGLVAYVTWWKCFWSTRTTYLWRKYWCTTKIKLLMRVSELIDLARNHLLLKEVVAIEMTWTIMNKFRQRPQWQAVDKKHARMRGTLGLKYKHSILPACTLFKSTDLEWQSDVYEHLERADKNWIPPSLRWGKHQTSF